LPMPAGVTVVRIPPCHRTGCDHLQGCHQGVRKEPAAPGGCTSTSRTAGVALDVRQPIIPPLVFVRSSSGAVGGIVGCTALRQWYAADLSLVCQELSRYRCCGAEPARCTWGPTTRVALIVRQCPYLHRWRCEICGAFAPVVLLQSCFSWASSLHMQGITMRCR